MVREDAGFFLRRKGEPENMNSGSFPLTVKNIPVRQLSVKKIGNVY